ncbi:MAG: hypothetical protein ACOCWR_09695 [Oceanidesulfovibrio sp.]
MQCIRKAVLFAACLVLVAVAGCGGEAPNDGGGNESAAAEQLAAPPEESPSLDIPADAKEVVGADGEVFHYTVDPCGVVPTSEVEEILGRPVTSKFSFVYGIPPYTRCEYAIELPEDERAGRSPDRLAISVVEPLTLSEAGFPGLVTGGDAYERHKSALTNAGAEIEDVRDLGDKAFLQSSDGVLHVVSGDVYMRVSANIYTKETAATLDELHQKMADNNAKVAVRFTADHLLPHFGGS